MAMAIGTLALGNTCRTVEDPRVSQVIYHLGPIVFGEDPILVVSAVSSPNQSQHLCFSCSLLTQRLSTRMSTHLKEPYVHPVTEQQDVSQGLPGVAS